MKAKIAVVGTGWWATENHLPALTVHPNAEIVAICDVDEPKVKKASTEFNVESVYTDLDTMLANEDLDGVMVATYHAAHYPVAKTCLEHGIHVYIEKPMVLFANHARELVELADAKGLQIVMGYNHNHQEYVIRARELVQSGEIGEVQYVTGQFSQAIFTLLEGNSQGIKARVHNPGDVYSDPVRSGGGQGHLQITHLAGMLFFVTGLRIKRVQAMMHNLELNVDVVNAITAQFDNGSLGTFGGTGNTRSGRCFKLTVYGEKGWIDIDDAMRTMIVHRENHEPEKYVADDHPFFVPTNNFVDVIVSDAENLCSGLLGWRAVELLDAAYRSANDDGKAVYLEELYEEQTT
jgi:predicted dehydrogenase